MAKRAVGGWALGVLLGCAAAGAGGGTWPAWRGPAGNGVVAADARGQLPPMEWDAKRNVRWRVPLPDRGNSTPVVWGDRIFLTQAIEREHRRTVMCLSADDGKLLWQSGVTFDETEPTNRQNPYCSASPATDGWRVVAYFGSAGLACYDTASGKELWRRDVGRVDSWQGSGSSPVIVREICVVNAGPGSDAALVACELETGRVVWRVPAPKPKGGGARPRGEAPPPELSKAPDAPVGKFDDAMMAADPRGAGGYLGSWATPVVVRIDGRDALVVVHPLQVTAYEPSTGKELWTCRDLPEQAFASPTFSGDVLLALGRPVDGGGTRATAIRLDGTGQKLWQRQLPKECVGSPVIAGNHAFLVTTFGSIICLDMKTGEKLEEKRLAGEGSRGGSWSSVLLVGDKLLVPNQSGEVFVMSADPELREIAINSIGDEITCSSLAASNRQLFLRTYDALWCFQRSE